MEILRYVKWCSRFVHWICIANQILLLYWYLSTNLSIYPSIHFFILSNFICIGLWDNSATIDVLYSLGVILDVRYLQSISFIFGNRQEEILWYLKIVWLQYINYFDMLRWTVYISKTFRDIYKHLINLIIQISINQLQLSCLMFKCDSETFAF